ncbi:hypothetical protein INT48_009740 [Thamnidium elegans]|uniref:Uncharacterized protein n=1 Tax=Thamnidium elegans TaxID=101142 RepID=A0A8H7SRH8_9FUNG|nr:hypothetical protein INT48_009740 [Thamnidium elegans]
MVTRFYYEDGQGKTVDKQGNDAMDWVEEVTLFHLETSTRIREYVLLFNTSQSEDALTALRWSYSGVICSYSFENQEHLFDLRICVYSFSLRFCVKCYVRSTNEHNHTPDAEVFKALSYQHRLTEEQKQYVQEMMEFDTTPSDMLGLKSEK